jgi:hypothetical protein
VRLFVKRGVQVSAQHPMEDSLNDSNEDFPEDIGNFGFLSMALISLEASAKL